MKDRIIKIENGTEYYVLEREVYQDKNYILALKCDLENDTIDNDTMYILEIYTENNEINIRTIDNQDIATKVAEVLLKKFRNNK